MTHVIVARWRPRDGQIEKIEAILRELAEKVRQEPGNLQFVVQRSHVRATMESKFWGACVSRGRPKSALVVRLRW